MHNREKVSHYTLTDSQITTILHSQATHDSVHTFIHNRSLQLRFIDYADSGTSFLTFLYLKLLNVHDPPPTEVDLNLQQKRDIFVQFSTLKKKIGVNKAW